MDRKWEIQKSGKPRIIHGLVTKHNANANDNIHACVALHNTDVNDNIHDYVAPHDRTMHTPLTTSTEHRAHSLKYLVSHHPHKHAPVMNPRPTTSTRPQSSPTCSSWTRRRCSPTKSLQRTPTTMTLQSRICSTKHIERKPITLYEKTCLSVCRRRQCPIERGDPFEIERRDPLSNETRKHRLGLCSTSKKRANSCRGPSKN